MRRAAAATVRFSLGAMKPPQNARLVGFDAETGGPAPVGVNPPNGFGLYDMSEGVHEWCSDYYDYNYYRNSPERNPPGAAFGERRVSRGGSWRHQIKFRPLRPRAVRCRRRSVTPIMVFAWR